MGYFAKFFAQGGRLGIDNPEVVDDAARVPAGTHQEFGNGAEAVTAVYLAASTSGVAAGTTCTIKDKATPVPNTANMGISVCVACAAIGSGKFGWFVVNGIAPTVWSATSAVGDDVFISGSGTLGPSAVAGKQVLGMVAVEAVTIASGTALVKCSMQGPHTQGQDATAA